MSARSIRLADGSRVTLRSYLDLHAFAKRQDPAKLLAGGSQGARCPQSAGEFLRDHRRAMHARITEGRPLRP